MQNNKRKILWIGNSMFPSMAKHLGLRPEMGSGSWMKTLLPEISVNGNYSLYVIHAGPVYKKIEQVTQDGVIYYGIPLPIHRWLFGANKKDIIVLKNLIKNISPDLIHVFGTEQYYGIAVKDLNIPTVLRIQGLLNCYIMWYFTGITLWDRIRYPWMYLIWISFNLRKRREIKILNSIKCFECQTDWDTAWVNFYNQNVCTYKNRPIVRSDFYSIKWNSKEAIPYSISAIISEAPYKGIHILIKAFYLLANRYPQATLRLIGGISRRGYGLLIANMISKLNLKNKILECGYLESEELANEISHSRVFVNPSFAENESLGRLEAMAAGVPTISSYAGGMPSVGKSKNAGLFFPPGDFAVLAYYIEKIWSDDSYAEKISTEQKNFIIEEINKENIINDTVTMYETVMNNYK